MKVWMVERTDGEVRAFADGAAAASFAKDAAGAVVRGPLDVEARASDPCGELSAQMQASGEYADGPKVTMTAEKFEQWMTTGEGGHAEARPAVAQPKVGDRVALHGLPYDAGCGEGCTGEVTSLAGGWVVVQCPAHPYEANGKPGRPWYPSMVTVIGAACPPEAQPEDKK